MVVSSANSWQNTFVGHQQDELFDKVGNILSGSSVAQRINDACSDPGVAFLIAQPNYSIKILHHLHHDCGTALAPGSGEVWGLSGADSHAAPMVIPAPAFTKKVDKVDAILEVLRFVHQPRRNCRSQSSHGH